MLYKQRVGLSITLLITGGLLFWHQWDTDKANVQQLVEEWKTDMFSRRIFVGSWNQPIGHYGYSDSLLPLTTPSADALFRFEPASEMAELAIELYKTGSLEAIHLLRVSALRQGIPFKLEDTPSNLALALTSSMAGEATRGSPLKHLTLADAVAAQGLRPSGIFDQSRAK